MNIILPFKTPRLILIILLNFFYTILIFFVSKVEGNKPNLPINVPNFQGNMPSISSNIPNLPGNEPNLPGNEPDLQGNIPSIPSNIPNPPGNVPNLPGNEPNLPGNEPNLPDNEPDLQGNMPIIPSNIPNPPENEPNLPDNEPDIQENMPSIPSNIPNSQENEPNFPDNEPDLQENLPSIPSNIPNSQENEPNPLSKMSNLLSNIPKLTGKLPGLNNLAKLPNKIKLSGKIKLPHNIPNLPGKIPNFLSHIAKIPGKISNFPWSTPKSSKNMPEKGIKSNGKKQDPITWEGGLPVNTPKHIKAMQEMMEKDKERLELESENSETPKSIEEIGHLSPHAIVDPMPSAPSSIRSSEFHKDMKYGNAKTLNLPADTITHNGEDWKVVDNPEINGEFIVSPIMNEVDVENTNANEKNIKKANPYLNEINDEKLEFDDDKKAMVKYSKTLYYVKSLLLV